MQKRYFLAAMLCVAVSAFGDDSKGKQKEPEDLSDHNNNAPIEVMEIRGASSSARVNQSRTRSPLMTYHGGKIMPTANIQSIFWGSSWTSSDPKITGLDSFYRGFSGSNYAKTSDEYTGPNGTSVGPTTVFAGHVIDTTAVSGINGGNNATAVLAEVCKMVNNLDPTGNGYYPVYTDQKRGNAGFCAWHSQGTCGNTTVQFAFFFNLDGDAGCDPVDKTTGNSQGLAALANVSAHELSEARTDPGNPGAWYDSSGSENGDKCAWTFGAPSVTFTYTDSITQKQVSNNWKLQGEWSNSAYSAGAGYPDSSGQRGCLSGQ